MSARELVVRRALERWLRTHPRARALNASVRRAQRALQRCEDGEAWSAYLKVEERVNARHEAIVDVVIRLVAKERDG